MESNIIIEDNSQVIYLFTIGALILAMILESLAPRRKLQNALARRWINNFSLGLVSWYLTMMATALVMLWIARQTELNRIGLFQQLDVHWLFAFFALLVVSQLLSYLLHMAFHKVSWLWPFHATHHMDTDVDVSTAYRNHPLENIITLPLVAPLILLLGAPVKATLAYHLFYTAVNVFSHSNVRVPAWLDRPLRLFIITPDFHRLHHCADRRYTDSNYGNAVPWFDYLFKTATWRPPAEQESMKLGLEYLREPADSRVDRLLLLPFTWRRKVTGREN